MANNRKEPFWIPTDRTLETTDFVVYDRERRTGGREVAQDRDGKQTSGWFFGQHTRYPARQMPEWAIRRVQVEVEQA